MGWAMSNEIEVNLADTEQTNPETSEGEDGPDSDTGYRWEQVQAPESILKQIGEAEFKPPETGEPPLLGAGGWEILRFRAARAGQMFLKLVYRRPWEEGVDPIKTFSVQVVVP